MDLTGQLIVSMPSMGDDRFYKTVIYICAHSEDGSMGIIINKKLDIEMYPDLLSKIGIDKTINNKKIYLRYGGPVETSRGFVLHSDDVIKEESLLIKKGIVLTGTANFFDDLLKGKGPKKSLLALGYAGWAPGQLEIEIRNNGWVTLPVNSNFIFDEKVSKKWEDAYKIIGVDPSSLTNFFGNA